MEIIRLDLFDEFWTSDEILQVCGENWIFLHIIAKKYNFLD